MFRLLGSKAAKWIPRRTKIPAAGSKNQQSGAQVAIRKVRVVSSRKKWRVLKTVGKSALIMFAMNAVTSRVFGDKDESHASRAGPPEPEPSSPTNSEEMPLNIFLPFPFTVQRHKARPFGPTSPEARELAKITEGSELEYEIKDQVIKCVVHKVVKTDWIVQRFGEPERVRGVLELWLPMRPHPFYSQAGILVTDKIIAWARRSPADPKAAMLQERLLSPTPAVMALWTYTKTVGMEALQRVFRYQSQGPKAPPSPSPRRPLGDGPEFYRPRPAAAEEKRRAESQRQRQQQGRLVAPSREKPLSGDNKEQDSGTATPSAKVTPVAPPPPGSEGGSSGRPPSPNQSQGGVSGGSSGPASSEAGRVNDTNNTMDSSKLLELARAPLTAVRDFSPDAWAELQRSLRALWRRPPTPPPGSVQVVGLCLVTMPRGTMALDVVAWWDPLTHKVDERMLYVDLKQFLPRTPRL